MSGTKVLLVITLGFAFVGFIFVGISIGVSRSIAHKKKVCTQQVVAQVVDIKRVRTRSLDSKNRSVSWYPVYEYWADNQKIQKRSNIGGLEHAFQIGQKVSLQINPQNVSEFYNPADQAGILQTIFLIVGLVLLACSAGILIFGKRLIAG